MENVSMSPKPNKKEKILIRDSQGHMYSRDTNGMIRKVSVEEGIRIEESINPLPKPYIDFLEKHKDRQS